MEKASGAHPEDHPLYAPGLKWRARAGGEVPYWIPPSRVVKAGWALKLVPLDKTASQEDIALRCRQLWAELNEWRAGKPAKTKFTISWLIQQYQSDPFSPYHAVKHKTRRGYDQSLKIIDDTVGLRQIDAVMEGGMLRPRIVGKDIRRWHGEWAMPDKEGKPTPVRAWHCMTMLRILFSYAMELGVPGAGDLRELVGTIRVPMAQARETAPQRDMVLAHVAKAVERGFLSMAITTLAQFEFTERRTHIIGTWEGPQWRPGWLWTGITSDWQITYHQTKIGKVERQFDLKATPALLDLLQRVPEESRVGAVIVCERTGKPWKERHYIRTFRAIARAAGLPDDMWSMDMRAGGATEAGQIQGVSQSDLQAAGGWKDPKMAARYTRDGNKRAAHVISLRQEKAARGTGNA